MEGYLAHKWGLTAELPMDHSFKNDFNETHTFGFPLHTLIDKSGQGNMQLRR